VGTALEKLKENIWWMGDWTYYKT